MDTTFLKTIIILGGIIVILLAVIIWDKVSEK